MPVLKVMVCNDSYYRHAVSQEAVRQVVCLSQYVEYTHGKNAQVFLMIQV